MKKEFTATEVPSLLNIIILKGSSEEETKIILNIYLFVGYI